MPAFINLTGKEFDRLTVISRAPNMPDGRIAWNCECACGNNVVVRSNCLQAGSTRSCGCLHKQVLSRISDNVTKHPDYNSWNKMKQRCFNKNDKDYNNYGGRGIKVCERWLNFANFITDMGPRPSGMTLERNDNDKGYSPENCRWATPLENTRNRRKTLMITWKGRTQPMTAWAEELGLNKTTLYGRLQKWSLKRAMTKPPIR